MSDIAHSALGITKSSLAGFDDELVDSKMSTLIGELEA